MTTEITTKIRSTIQEIQADADRRIAELQQLEQTTAAQVAELALSETQRQRSNRRAAERADIEQAMQSALATWRGEYADLANTTGAWRAAALETLARVQALGAEQMAIVGQLDRMNEAFALSMRSYANAYESDVEFMLALSNLVTELAGKVQWSLGVASNLRQCLGIRDPGWQLPMGGDRRRLAINTAMRRPLPVVAPVEVAPGVEGEVTIRAAISELIPSIWAENVETTVTITEYVQEADGSITVNHDISPIPLPATEPALTGAQHRPATRKRNR